MLKGWPVRTIVHGVTVMDNGKIVGPGGHGKYLWRRIGEPPILGKLSQPSAGRIWSHLSPEKSLAGSCWREKRRTCSTSV